MRWNLCVACLNCEGNLWYRLDTDNHAVSWLYDVVLGQEDERSRLLEQYRALSTDAEKYQVTAAQLEGDKSSLRSDISNKEGQIRKLQEKVAMLDKECQQVRAGEWRYIWVLQWYISHIAETRHLLLGWQALLYGFVKYMSIYYENIIYLLRWASEHMYTKSTK